MAHMHQDKTRVVRQNQASDPVDRGAIAKVAYELWLRRGRPDGSPEEDWYEAERMLKAEGQKARPSTPTRPAARKEITKTAAS